MHFTTLLPFESSDSWVATLRAQGRGRQRQGHAAVVRRHLPQFPAVPPDAGADPVHGPPDAAGRQPRLRVREVQGQAALGRHAEDHLRRRGGMRRGEAGARGDHRLPEGPAEVPAAGRPAAQGRAAHRPARNRQDAARQSGGRRSGPSVLLDVGLGFRRDVRRRRCLAGARPVRAGQGARALHHLHRRDRRGRPPSRRRPGRRARRA